jgi:hypothetical protein
MKANITRSSARVGQPRLVVEATPDGVKLQFRCGRCQRVLSIDPDDKHATCICRNTVETATLLNMALATLEELEGAVCAVTGRDDFFEEPEVTNEPDDPEPKDDTEDEVDEPGDVTEDEG